VKVNVKMDTCEIATIGKIYKGCNLVLAGKTIKVNFRPLLRPHFSAINVVNILFPLGTKDIVSTWCLY
jgi:hypothetical protein